jgi:Putative Flp pilus-assembly TadE/G-like
MQRREPAQVIALFAISMLAMLAMIGVAVDGGTLYVQRRTAQNSADAAALAGARALQKATQSPAPAISTAICTYVLANSFGVTPAASAYFVNTSGSSLGTINLPSGCSPNTPINNSIPTGSSGVHVDVTIGPYNTYLVGIVGLRQLQASASATAQVGLLSIPNPDITPLAGCGPDMLTNGNSPTPFVNILLPDNANINPALYYPTATTDLVLQGSQISQNENSTCPKWNGTSSAWKGQVDTSGITGTFSPPLAVPVATGNSNIDSIIVSMCTSLYGPGADPTGTGAGANKCFLLVPIAAPPNPTNDANIVTLACFSIYDGESGTQKWRGVLYPPSYCSYGIYPPSWTYGNTNTETEVLLTS